MDTIRHMALGVCVISTVAGMIRVFWPENGFAAVINAVLALYIITAALQMVRGTDWQELATELYRLPVQEQQPAEYEAYGKAIGLASSLEAVRTVLRQAGIEASVQMQENVCCVILPHSEDKARAEAVLASSCGTLSYEVSAGGEKP